MLNLLKTSKLICFALAAIFVFSGNSIAQTSVGNEKKELASDIWTNAFGWIQTGRKLAEAKQWPLALGSYIEALQKYQIVARDFPEFEPELVSFRLDALKTDIEDIQKKLAADDHDVMMAYLDFIDSMEKGQDLRFANNLKEALPILRFAMTLLKEVIKNSPDEFRDAVDDQYVRLDESINWIDSQLNRKLRRPIRASATDSENWGTTDFIKASDLPGNVNIPMSNRLFPDAPPFLDAPAVKAPVAVEKPKSNLTTRLPKSLGPGNVIPGEESNRTKNTESTE